MTAKVIFCRYSSYRMIEFEKQPAIHKILKKSPKTSQTYTASVFYVISPPLFLIIQWRQQPIQRGQPPAML